VNEKKIMDIPQPLLDLGYDPAMTATLFAVFKDTVEISIKQALANSLPLVSSPGTELKHNDKFKAAAESIFSVARKLGDGPEEFCSEFERIREIYRNKSDRKNGSFGFNLQSCYLNRSNEIEEQQRRDKEQQDREAYLSSPEFQRKQAAIEETAKGEPMHPRFVFTDVAITDRVLLASNPVDAWRILNSYKDRVAMHSKTFVKSMKLGHQDEIYAQADIRGEIWRQAFHKLNGFYRQQTKATAKDLEEAVNEACRKVTPTVGPCFLPKDE
jgi:hypothetical protein